jgi:hypothetical protein
MGSLIGKGIEGEDDVCLYADSGCGDRVLVGKHKGKALWSSRFPE